MMIILLAIIIWKRKRVKVSIGPSGPKSQGNASESQFPCTEYNCMCVSPWKKMWNRYKSVLEIFSLLFSLLLIPTLTIDAWLQMPPLLQPGSEFGCILLKPLNSFYYALPCACRKVILKLEPNLTWLIYSFKINHVKSLVWGETLLPVARNFKH